MYMIVNEMFPDYRTVLMNKCADIFETQLLVF